MTRSRFSLILFVSVAACAACSVAYRVVDWVERSVAWAFSFLARPARTAPSFGGIAFAGGPAPSYSAPSVHSMRHEAGTARRAAARNV